jgi:hypothetical protein
MILPRSEDSAAKVETFRCRYVQSPREKTVMAMSTEEKTPPRSRASVPTSSELLSFPGSTLQLNVIRGVTRAAGKRALILGFIIFQSTVLVVTTIQSDSESLDIFLSISSPSSETSILTERDRCC